MRIRALAREAWFRARYYSLMAVYVTGLVVVFFAPVPIGMRRRVRAGRWLMARAAGPGVVHSPEGNAVIARWGEQ